LSYTSVALALRLSCPSTYSLEAFVSTKAAKSDNACECSTASSKMSSTSCLVYVVALSAFKSKAF